MRQLCRRVILACALLVLLAPQLRAKSLVRARKISGVDWVSAGVGGIPADTADITVTGVNGTVTAAFLYWGGINPGDGIASYDNGTIKINDNTITGTNIGDTGTNCWGQGASRVYVADVTPYVTGDGTYTLTDLMQQPTYSVNGASLVVLFDDGDPTNDRDLIFYEGNDSTDIRYTGYFEDRGWHDFLDNIYYVGGTVRMQLHVADGQSVNAGDDGDFTFHGPNNALTITNESDPTLFDGQSVPQQGVGRAPGDALWDIHTFDVSSIFGAGGNYGVYIDSDPYPADCIALVAVIVDVAAAPPGPPPPICGDGIKTPDEECDDGNLVNGDCCDATCRAEPAGTVCSSATDPCLEARCDGHGTCDAEGLSCRVPVAPGAGQLVLRHGKKDRFTWKWTTGVSTAADFGNPLQTTAYDLCVYDKGTGSLRLLLSESAAAGPAWHATPSSFAFHDGAGSLQNLTLQGGLPGKAKIVARSVGGAFTLPALPLAPPVVVRLRAQDGLCWGVNYSTPDRNTRRRFASRGDSVYPH